MMIKIHFVFPVIFIIICTFKRISFSTPKDFYQAIRKIPSIVYDNLAFGFFKLFMKMIRFCSTNNSSKKKWKNTSLLLYKYAHIKITLLSKDNS